jgi:hypothetical protein
MQRHWRHLSNDPGSARLRKSNFFILGAPKCGTTSLATWLAEHPNIFMSSYKEPHFFNTDDKRVVDTLEYYENFFAGAGPQHLAIGEASVWYLSSAHAVRGILSYAPEARFVVMLRNPIEMAPALHAEMVFTGMENERDFATAWQLQEVRRAGRLIPASCSVPRRLFYGEACSLGAQLGHLLALVPVRRVLTILLDDLRQDARREYLRALKFLDVADDGRSDFAVQNTSKIRRWPSVAKLSHEIMAIRGRLGIKRGLGLWRHIDAMNRTDQRRRPLSPEFEAALKQYFSADVARLGQLLNRNL